MAVSTETAAVVREIRADESAEWDEFVGSAPNGHLLQGWAWGEFKRGHGWQPVRLGLVRDGRIEAGAQVLLRSVAGLSLAYVPRGPVAPADRPEMYAAVLHAVHRLARSRHAIFLKVEPNEPKDGEIGQMLRREDFVHSPHTVQPRATIVLDLAGGADAVWKRFGSKTRYYVRQAEKRGVVARPASGEEDVLAFYEVMKETGERGGFPVRSAGYYRDVLEEFRSRGQAELFVGEAGGRVIGGVLAFAFGREGLYMYAGSSNEHREKMPNYLLQWKAIQWCIEKGCERYDLWGIPERAALHGDEYVPPQEGKEPEMWGVYRFKRRFGDTVVRYTGAYDYPYIRPLYLLWRRLRKNKEM